MQERRDRRLARARWADEGDYFARGDRQRSKIAEHLGQVLSVPKAYVLERDGSARGTLQGLRVVRLSDGRRRAQHLEDTSRGANRFLVAAEERGQ